MIPSIQVLQAEHKPHSECSYENIEAETNGRHFADILFNEKCCTVIRLSPKLVPVRPIGNTPALAQITITPMRRRAIN